MPFSSMSFFKKLFGRGGGDAQGAASGPSEDHEGYTITATPYQASGRWQLCGVISKQVNGEKVEHRFVRADTFSSREEAEQMTFAKGRLIIDQSAGRLFGEG